MELMMEDLDKEELKGILESFCSIVEEVVEEIGSTLSPQVAEITKSRLRTELYAVERDVRNL